MAKKQTRKRISSSDRAKIMAEAKTKGMTAQQVAKKYGISAWTYYGWRKRTSKTARRASRLVGRGTTTGRVSANTLRSEIRAVLPGILRDELARTMAALFGVKKSRRG